MRADVVIAKIGDGKLKVTARRLGIPFPTVQHWKRTNEIPAWRHTDIRKVAKQMGVDVEEA